MAGSSWTYGKDELDQYFDRIDLYGRTTKEEVWSSGFGQLNLLKILQRRQMACVPFENLSLHYSQHHSISIDSHALFRKIVVQERGGYCMENNTFFGGVLRSLDYSLYSAGARVCMSGDSHTNEHYSGWSHMVNIVSIDNKRWLVDVGFGPDGPIEPVLLEDGAVSPGAGMQVLRLQRRNIAENTNADQRLWVLEYRRHADSPWASLYCFTELEFLPQDFAYMNHATSTMRTSWFTTSVVCSRTIVESDEVVGSVILQDKELKMRRDGETKVLVKFETELQRVKALTDWYGISLTEDEHRGIKGLVTELKVE